MCNVLAMLIGTRCDGQILSQFIQTPSNVRNNKYTHGACAVLTVLPSVSSVPDPKPTSMSKALKVRHLGWLMRTMGESVHWINWVSKELNIYPFTNASVVLVSSYWDVDWWSICPGDTDHFRLGIYISGERPVKVRSSRGQLYPCSSFTDEMSLHGLIFTSSLKLSQILSLLNKLSLSWQARVKSNLSLNLSNEDLFYDDERD